MICGLNVESSGITRAFDFEIDVLLTEPQIFKIYALPFLQDEILFYGDEKAAMQ